MTIVIGRNIVLVHNLCLGNWARVSVTLPDYYQHIKHIKEIPYSIASLQPTNAKLNVKVKEGRGRHAVRRGGRQNVRGNQFQVTQLILGESEVRACFLTKFRAMNICACF